MKKKMLFMITVFIYLFGFILPKNVYAEDDIVDNLVDSMTVEEKIAQMMMPAFEVNGSTKITNITPEIEQLLNEYNIGGILLFAANAQETEQTTRLIYEYQTANAANPNCNTQLFIGIDQEGGYVTRLGIGTEMPGNMALAATDNPELAYESANIIGTELEAVGVNVDFAPVVDVNSNPENPVIGLRSFSDDPEIVSEYGTQYMNGLHDANISTALKHFPGHGDTSEDTHENKITVDKSLDELKEVELKPFQELINNNTDMIMTAHISYPQVEPSTYTTESGEELYLPATLSETIITGLLREEMGFDGVVITDAMNMGAITAHFNQLEAATLAINAGVDMILMPVNTNSATGINNFKTYINNVAALVKNGTIDSNKVDAAVKRILTLKNKRGLLEEYNVNIDEKVANALEVVSTVENHNVEFEIAKKAITMLKNENNTLPISTEEKTIIFYEYSSHLKALDNAIAYLKKAGTEVNADNITMAPFYTPSLDLDSLKEQIEGYDNVVLIRAQYEAENLTDPDLDKMVELIDYAHEQNKKVVMMEAHLPYEIAKFTNADALVLTYLANGIRFMIDDYDSSIPKYGPNIIAGFYMLFTDKDDMNGVLPVNIYKVDENDKITDEVIFKRGFGLHYKNF